MINVNNVVLVGRLTKDIELRKTQNNTSVCQFSVAIDRPKRKDQEQETDFINCVAWSYSAEYLSNYAKKGMIVSVEGKIRTRNYENQQGQKVYVTEIQADNVQIVGSGKQESEAPAVKNNNVSIEPDELPFY